MPSTLGPLCKDKLLGLGIINYHLKRAALIYFVQRHYFKNHEGRLYTYREIYENGCEMRKTKSVSGVFCVFFFWFRAPFFAFRISLQVGICGKTQTILWFIFSRH